MRVAILSLRFAPGHIAHLRAYRELFKALGCEVRLFLDPDYAGFFSEWSDVEFTELSENIFIWEPDTVFSYNIANANVGLSKKCKNKGIPFFYVLHEPWDSFKELISLRQRAPRRMARNSCVLVKNENYFDPNDAAQNDKLIFRIIPEATTRTIMVQTGEADVNVNFDTAAMADCQADPNVQVLEHESSTIYYIALNCETGPFTNKQLRQAVAWAINRADCLEVGYNGYGKEWSNVWAPTVYGATDDPYTYDMAKAQELVTASGYAGQEIKACVKTDAEERIAQVVQAYLSMVGVNMTYTRIDNTILTEAMANNQYDMAFDYTAFYNDPELFVGRQFQASGIGAKNYAHYTSSEVDELMEKAKATLDEAERAEIYHQINAILCDDCPWIGMFNSNLYALARTGVQGVNINVETTYWYNTIRYEQ